MTLWVKNKKINYNYKCNDSYLHLKLFFKYYDCFFFNCPLSFSVCFNVFLYEFSLSCFFLFINTQGCHICFFANLLLFWIIKFICCGFIIISIMNTIYLGMDSLDCFILKYEIYMIGLRRFLRNSSISLCMYACILLLLSCFRTVLSTGNRAS